MLLLLNGCSSVPITGRKQLNLVSDEQVLSSSIASYNSFMTSAKQANAISTDKTKTAQVVRVGQKIAAATEAYLRATGLESDIKNFAWEFNLVKSNEMNAWCMPGGKIVVYEGLMKIVGSDDDLAVVLGHEVLGKPANLDDARRMLRELSGQTHQVITGVCLMTRQRQRSFAVTTDVTFKTLSDEEIDYYVEKYQPLDKAGAYGIQEWIGYIGVTSLSGSYFNVMGLPVQRIYNELLKF